MAYFNKYTILKIGNKTGTYLRLSPVKVVLLWSDGSDNVLVFPDCCEKNWILSDHRAVFPDFADQGSVSATGASEEKLTATGATKGYLTETVKKKTTGENVSTEIDADKTIDWGIFDWKNWPEKSTDQHKSTVFSRGKNSIGFEREKLSIDFKREHFSTDNNFNQQKNRVLNRMCSIEKRYFQNLLATYNPVQTEMEFRSQNYHWRDRQSRKIGRGPLEPDRYHVKISSFPQRVRGGGGE